MQGMVCLRYSIRDISRDAILDDKTNYQFSIYFLVSHTMLISGTDRFIPWPVFIFSTFHNASEDRLIALRELKTGLLLKLALIASCSGFQSSRWTFSCCITVLSSKHHWSLTKLFIQEEMLKEIRTKRGGWAGKYNRQMKVGWKHAKVSF